MDLNAGVLRVFLDGQTVLTQQLPPQFQLEVIQQSVQTDRIVTLENYSNGTAFKGLIDNLLIYDRALASVPAVTNMAPTMRGVSEGPVTVNLTGVNFEPGVSTVLSTSPSVATISNVNVVSASSITLQLTPVSVGITNLQITNSNGATVVSPLFTVSEIVPAPTISGISRTTGGPGTLFETLTGTNLSNASSVIFSGAGVAATIGAGGTATSLPIRIDIASGAAAGLRTITVTTSAGASVPFSGFTVNSTIPVITGISPSSGVQGNTVAANISGSNLSGATAVTFASSGITATIDSGGTATNLPVHLAIGPSAVNSLFTVTTPQGTSSLNLNALFTVNSNAPAIGSLIPAQRVVGSGAFRFDVLGNNFISGSEIEFNGTRYAATVIDTQHVWAQIPGTEITVIGPLSVRVAVPDAVNTGSFVFSAPAMFNVVGAAISLSPNPVSLSVGGTFPVTVSVNQAPTSPISISVVSSDPNTATVVVSPGDDTGQPDDDHRQRDGCAGG